MADEQISVSLQELSDCGLNPFAATLLVESWLNHPEPKKVSFPLRGVVVTLQSFESFKAERPEAQGEAPTNAG